MTKKRPSRNVTRIVVDVLFAADIVLLMATGVPAGAPHERLGIIAFVLFALHLWLNRRWVTHLSRGRWTPRRICVVVINTLLALSMVAVMGSSLVLSRFVFAWLPVLPGMSLARMVHLASSAWLLILAGAHAGMHVRIDLGGARSRNVVTGCVFLVVGLYGIWSLFQLGIPEILTLRSRFSFADTRVPMIALAVRYASVFLLTGELSAAILHIARVHRRAAER